MIPLPRLPALLCLPIAAAPASAACTTHQCDPTSVEVTGGTVTSQGSTLLWQSAPAAGPWTDFPGNATIHFTYPPGFACPTSFQAYVSTAATQNTDAATFVEASGQLSEFSLSLPDGISVTNATCAGYYLYVVATAPASGCAGDAGGDPIPSTDGGADAARE